MRLVTVDSFQNFQARLGIGTGNLNDCSQYGFNPITRNRLGLENCYRGSWIAGKAVDSIAEDMTRKGVEIHSDDSPEQLQDFEKENKRLQTWKQLKETIKWSRLYGGSIGFMMIDGQDPSTPLKIDRVGEGQFKGLLPMDRWLVQPSLNDLVSDYGPDYGKPCYYETVTTAYGGIPRMVMHHSRIIRFEGIELPYWQKISENWWGQSVLERLWDRLVAFDSVTTGAAQLVHKAHLRTLSIEGLRDAILMGGQAVQGILQQVAMIRGLQTIEGMTVIDSKDKFETHQYAFSGLDDLLLQFGQQLSGALDIPLVRLFGQSPAGLSATGESDMKVYREGIKQRQESDAASSVDKLYRVQYRSKFGKNPPKSWELEFKSLDEMTDVEKGAATLTVVDAITKAFDSQIIDAAQALRELRALSRVTGYFSSISDEDIQKAVEHVKEMENAPSPAELGLDIPGRGIPGAGAPPAPAPIGANAPRLRAV
jgi:phage-related protein (TIGR01555 family)